MLENFTIPNTTPSTVLPHTKDSIEYDHYPKSRENIKITQSDTNNRHLEGSKKSEDGSNDESGSLKSDDELEKEEEEVQDDDEDTADNEEESEKTPTSGPLIDSELIPTQAMLASANPYLNPMHPLHPFKHEFDVKHHYNTPHGMVTYTNGASGSGPGDVGVGGMGVSGNEMRDFDSMMGIPSHLYPDKCASVQHKATRIANKLMKDYNKRVFRKIMNYLLKSKFLIGMTEIKLNRIMRKKIYNVMSSFSRVSKDNIEFVESSQEPVLSDEDDSIDSDVQDIDFSNITDMGPDKGTSTEMYDMLNNQMETQGNVHLSD